jgi:hypothetical protein
MDAFAAAGRFFSAAARGRGDALDDRVGPHLATLFVEAGIEPQELHVFPVSTAQLGPPDPASWQQRRRLVEQLVEAAPDEAARRAGRDYLQALDAYAASSAAARPGFVELQSTLLFAVVGQRAATGSGR